MPKIVEHISLGDRCDRCVCDSVGRSSRRVALGASGMASLTGGESLVEREDLRHHIGYYLLLGLEFLIAADIVHTVLTPTLADLAVLGAIVAIRTVISFSINWELRQVRRHEARGGKST
jgi:hypothetical protein